MQIDLSISLYFWVYETVHYWSSTAKWEKEKKRIKFMEWLEYVNISNLQ